MRYLNNCNIIYRSWLIEDSVKSDGKMHLSTPIDPIFLVLPYLRKVNVQNTKVFQYLFTFWFSGLNFHLNI